MLAPKTVQNTYQKSIENNEQIIVGVNKFKSSVLNTQQAILETDHKAANNQLERLKKFKNNRSQEEVTKNLNALSQAINDNENLVPYIIRCIKNDCTLGDICNTIKNIYGQF